MANGSRGKLNIVVLGLSITSSWGNGHATTYRSLLGNLAALGHRILFLERDMPWYAAHRDLPQPGYCELQLYRSVADLEQRFASEVADADAVIVGSYVPEGVAVGEWAVTTARSVTAFYDIDTPVTLAKLERGDTEYLSPELIPRYDLYLSFTGGPILRDIERRYGSPRALPLYCSVDETRYRPDPSVQPLWDLGYMGTYSDDRQPSLQRLLIDAARLCPDRRFVVAGPLYPTSIEWPANVERIEHLPPDRHREFYCAQRFTLNITRRDMIAAGFSPSVRLFEAAACGVPLISDYWDGLDTVLQPGSQILISGSGETTASFLSDLPDRQSSAIADAARAVVLARDTSARRAQELESYLLDALRRPAQPMDAAPLPCGI